MTLPFERRVDGRLGAPMGRRSDPLSIETERLHLRRVKL